MDILSLLNPIELIKNFTEWFCRPKPSITFEYKLSRLSENDYCQFRFNTTFNSESLFFRLGVNNFGKKRIEEADVRVEKIEIIDKDGCRQKVRSSPFFLHWANENTDNSRSIYPNTPVFIDFIFTTQNKVGVAFLFSKQKHRGSGIKEFITPGKWIVTIKLLGTDIQPILKEILIDFNGVWDKIIIKLI